MKIKGRKAEYINEMRSRKAPFSVVLRNTASFAISLLYPRVCPGCGEIIKGSDAQLEKRIYEGNPYICQWCYARLDFIERPRCMKCSKPLEAQEEEFCRNCRQNMLSFDAGTALMLHDDISRKIIYDMKYSGLKDNADFIALEIVRRCFRIIVSWNADAILPVPLHRSKLLQRGFNQAQLIAEKVIYYMKRFSLPAPALDLDTLERSLKTAPQKGLTPGERGKNIKNAFVVNGNRWAGKRVIVLDDIHTTGATLNECAGVLKSAGIAEVFFITATITN